MDINQLLSTEPSARSSNPPTSHKNDATPWDTTSNAVPNQDKREGLEQLRAVERRFDSNVRAKWTAEEDDLIIYYRGNDMKWEDISRSLPGRSAIACRLRYQNFLERKFEWDEGSKTKFAVLYERFKQQMFEPIAKELGIPWRAVEAMHWDIGREGMSQRSGAPPFETR